MKIAHHLAAITEAAALACYPHRGRGDGKAADQAAVTAMHNAFMQFPAQARLVIGEGEKDDAPQMNDRALLGTGEGDSYDLVIDPLEGTTFLRKNLPNAFAVIGISAAGTMFDPGPSFYMEKIALPAAARGKVMPDMPTSEILTVLAKAQGKPISELTIYVLDRPRHQNLLAEIYQCGARAMAYSGGDLLGSILAAKPDDRVDAMIGTGGTPEALLSACAIHCLGGDFFARIDPQSELEQQRVTEAGITDQWLELQQLVASDSVGFCATAITDSGLWLRGVEADANGRYWTETAILSTDQPAQIVRRCT